MNEVVQGARRTHLTSLLAALHHDAARLYVAEHVLGEMERDLPVYAEGRGVDAMLAVGVGMPCIQGRVAGGSFTLRLPQIPA